MLTLLKIMTAAESCTGEWSSTASDIVLGLSLAGKNTHRAFHFGRREQKRTRAIKSISAA